MTLNEFRTKELIWDKATKQIYESFEANSGDSNGRKLVVQVLDGGVIADLSGAQLHLSWKTNTNNHKGLDAFKAVNLSKGIFEIAYTTEMLSNVGRLQASLVLIDNVGRVESNLFMITVFQSNVDDDSVQSEDSFTALTEALVTVSKYDTRISDLEISKADKVEVEQLTTQLEQTEEQLTTQLTHTEEQLTIQLAHTNEQLTMSELYSKAYGDLKLYNPPTEFDLNIPFDIYTSDSGRVDYDYDVSINKHNVSKRVYVDMYNGSIYGDGTESKPHETLHQAFSNSDVDEIVVKEGIYGWYYGGEGRAPNNSRKINIIGEGDVYLGAHRDYTTWTEVSGASGVYTTSVSNVREIIDINNGYDNPIFYKKMESASEVQNKSGSYYIGNQNNITVKTISGEEPNDKILLNMIQSTLDIREHPGVYFENIKFTNTVRLSNTSYEGRYFFKECGFNFGSGDNSLSVFGNIQIILQDCSSKYGERDGFNYHVSGGYLPEAMELGCVGSFNGRDGADQNNGSTMHDGGTVLRINGEYAYNEGPNVIDVNNGTQSLNIGVHAHNSVATNDVSNVDFRIRDEGAGSDMWLINCVSNGSNYSKSVGSTARLHEVNSLLVKGNA